MTVDYDAYGFLEPEEVVRTVDVWTKPPAEPEPFRLEIVFHLDGIQPPYSVLFYELEDGVWTKLEEVPDAGGNSADDALESGLRWLGKYIAEG